jgi:hypothetical protein
VPLDEREAVKLSADGIAGILELEEGMFCDAGFASRGRELVD